MFFLKGFLDFLAVYFKRPKFAIMTAIILFAISVVIAVYGVRTVSDIPVYVVDHDNTTVSRSIRLFLDSGPDLKVLGSLESLDEAKAHLYEGDAVAVIYIPDGTSQAIKTQSGAKVFSYIDGTNMLMAKSADKAIQTVIKSASVGITMIAMNKQGLPKQSLMGALQPVNLDVDRPFNALTIYSDYLLPVLIFFNLNIFTCIMTCACFQEALPKEIKQRTYRRRFFVMGRLLAVFVVALLFGLAIYIFALPLIDIYVQSSTEMAVGSLIVYIILTMMLFTNLNLMFPVPVSMSLCYLMCMLSVMFSGLTWPLESMPWYLQEITSWIPMTPFLQAVQIFLYHEAKPEDLSFFYNMFVKQAIFYTCLAFVLMRCRDIVYVLMAVWKKHKAKRVVALAADGVAPIPVEVADDGANEPEVGKQMIPGRGTHPVEQVVPSGKTQPGFAVQSVEQLSPVSNEPEVGKQMIPGRVTHPVEHVVASGKTQPGFAVQSVEQLSPVSIDRGSSTLSGIQAVSESVAVPVRSLERSGSTLSGMAPVSGSSTLERDEKTVNPVTSNDSEENGK